MAKISTTRFYGKAVSGALGLIFLLSGAVIFGYKLSGWITPIMLLTAALVLGLELYVKRSVDTLQEIGALEFAIILVALGTASAGIAGLFMIDIPLLSTIGSIGMLFAAIVLLMDAFIG